MPKRIRKISFLLSKDELRLLREACLYGASAEGRLKSAVQEQGKVRLEFPYEELDDLAGHVASGANHETSSRKQARWDALAEKLESLLRLADKMLFLFDYGDGWRFVVELKDIQRAARGDLKPIILERVGVMLECCGWRETNRRILG